MIMGKSSGNGGNSGAGITSSTGLGWVENFLGGSPEAETAFILQAMNDIHVVQRRNQKAGNAKSAARAFHAKIQAGITNAEFVIAADVPAELRSSVFTPGRRYRTKLRFSNASGVIQPDTKGDLRGLAAEIETDDGVQHFLGTNGAASHARDARQFIEFAKAASGSKILMFPRLFWNIGVFETVRMLRTVIGQVKRPIASLATESYFSRSAFAFGKHALKFQFTPAESVDVKTEPSDSFLRDDLVARLRRGRVVFDFQVQYFSNEKDTPVEDGTVIWPTRLVTIAQLVIPQQDLLSVDALAAQRAVEAVEFTPWKTTKGIRPLGSLNRARRSVYPASVEFRKGQASS
jgi:catalase